MNNNPLFMLMQMLQGGASYQQMMGVFGNNPLMAQAMKMMQGKSPEQMMELFQNVANQKGMSQEQFNQFMNMFGIK